MVVRTVAHAPAVVGKRDVDVARAFGALVRAWHGVAAVACVRVRVRMRVMLEPGGRRVVVRAAAGGERDADRLPGRHADDRLRKQEERKHETEQELAHRADEGREMYRPIRTVGQGGDAPSA